MAISMRKIVGFESSTSAGRMKLEKQRNHSVSISLVINLFKFVCLWCNIDRPNFIGFFIGSVSSFLAA